jgi:osmotically-inducible protein OsmY
MPETPELAQRVRAALEFERRVNLHRFPIQITAAADRLRLQGPVGTVAAKRLAVRIATDLAAGDGLVVEDGLHVAPATEHADGEIADALGATLLASPEFRPLSVRRQRGAAQLALRAFNGEATGEILFTVREGAVELAGIVPSLSHRRLAEALAWWSPGCRNVVNQLVVAPPERDGDDELADAVGLVLEVDPALPDAQPIGVNATFGVVTLTGSLRDEGQRQRAEFDAWCVDGVKDVRNAIAVGR